MGNLATNTILQNMDLAVNLADTYNIKVFSESMGHPEPIKIVIVK